MIKIDEYWSIETDTYCFKLVKETTGEISQTTGKPIVSRYETYHPTLAKCLQFYANESFKTAVDIPGILRKIDEMNAKIESFV